jgi:hypothetical protein
MVYGATGSTFQTDHLYKFSIDLLVPNYVTVTPMPVAAIENRFRLMLELGYLNLGYVLERVFLVNESFGYISTSNPHYTIGLGNQNSFLLSS